MEAVIRVSARRAAEEGAKDRKSMTTTAIPILSGIVAVAVTLGILWPIAGDPDAIPLLIGAAPMVGSVVGGVAYLSMNAKR